ERHAKEVQTFTTTTDLQERLKALAGESIGAVFHAAAVSDFRFGAVWERTAKGELVEIKSGKISTRRGTLLAELAPTPKILAELRPWFPQGFLAGWKYEVEGGRAGVIASGQRQLAECRTDACVLNGPAYGAGFGLLMQEGTIQQFEDMRSLFEALHREMTN